MNKLGALFLSTLVGASLFAASTADAASTSIKIVGPNGIIESDVSPYLVKGTTMVPLTVISKIGLKSVGIQWDNTQKMATFKSDNQIVTLKINEMFAMKGTEKVNLAVPITIKSGRIMVPLRFIVEAINEQVDWSASSRTVTIVVTDTSVSDLTQKRLKAIHLPRVNLKDQINAGGLMTVTVYFPVGISDQFLECDENLISFYKVKDGEAIQIWSAKSSEEAATNKGLPFFPYKILKEI